MKNQSQKEWIKVSEYDKKVMAFMEELFLKVEK